MKTKKSGIYAALTVVLLLTAVLVISCPELLTPDGLKLTDSNQPGDFVPPEKGKPGANGQPEDTVSSQELGYVKLNFGSSSARTIMPLYADIDAADFEAFVVSFENQATGAGKDAFDDIVEFEDTLLPLPASALDNLLDYEFSGLIGDTYEIIVNAYLEWTGASSVAAATATIDVLISNTGNSEPIVLRPIIDGTKTGIFEWDLSYDGDDFSDLDVATLVLENLDGTPAGLSVDLTDSGSEDDSDDIDSGYYRVVVTLELEDHISKVYTDVVHIYQGMTSSFSIDFDELVAIPVYTITFNNYNGTGDTTTANTNYKHGVAIGDTSTYPYAATLNSNPRFLGWYTDTAGTGFAVPLTTKVYVARTLFGNWAPTATVSVSTVSFSTSDKGLVLSLGTLPTISYSALSTPNPLNELLYSGSVTFALNTSAITSPNTVISYGINVEGFALVEDSTAGNFILSLNLDDDLNDKIAPTKALNIEVWAEIEDEDNVTETYSRVFSITVGS